MVVLTNNNNEEQDFILIEERKCTSLPSSPAKRVSPAKKKFFIRQAIRNSDLTPGAKGKKKPRRQEDMLADLERDQCSTDDLEVGSNPSIPSSFTKAFNNELWSDFMNRSGEEQEELLTLLEKEERQKTENNNRSKDQSNVNSVFAAHDRFRRIDRRLRTILRQRQFPMRTLEVLEEGLLSFFNAQPQSVYITNLSISFERLLLHAVCQYMNLVSASNNCKGARQTKVENRQDEFLPPSPLLSAYLDQKV